MTDKVRHKIYRPNVAIVVLDKTGKLLACERSDIAGIWQIPQGGLDEGEAPEAGMLRELKEEIGTADIEILGRLPHTIRYDWPPRLYKRGFHGQEQYYFLVRLRDGAKIKLKQPGVKQEFTNFEWVTKDEFLARCKGFKREVYLQAIEALVEHFPGLLK